MQLEINFRTISECFDSKLLCESIFDNPKMNRASGEYKYLSATRVYDGISMCKNGNNAKKKDQESKNKLLDFFFVRNINSGVISQTIRNKRQNIE